jgi:hypothetical protein
MEESLPSLLRRHRQINMCRKTSTKEMPRSCVDHHVFCWALFLECFAYSVYCGASLVVLRGGQDFAYNARKGSASRELAGDGHGANMNTELRPSYTIQAPPQVTATTRWLWFKFQLGDTTEHEYDSGYSSDD